MQLKVRPKNNWRQLPQTGSDGTGPPVEKKSKRGGRNENSGQKLPRREEGEQYPGGGPLRHRQKKKKKKNKQKLGTHRALFGPNPTPIWLGTMQSQGSFPKRGRGKVPGERDHREWRPAAEKKRGKRLTSMGGLFPDEPPVRYKRKGTRGKPNHGPTVHCQQVRALAPKTASPAKGDRAWTRARRKWS